MPGPNGEQLYGPLPRQALKESQWLPTASMVYTGENGRVLVVVDGLLSLLILENSQIRLSFDSDKPQLPVQLQLLAGGVRLVTASAANLGGTLLQTPSAALLLAKAADSVVYYSDQKTVLRNYASDVRAVVLNPKNGEPADRDGRTDIEEQRFTSSQTKVVPAAFGISLRAPLDSAEQLKLTEQLGAAESRKIADLVASPQPTPLAKADYRADEEAVSHAEMRELPTIQFETKGDSNKSEGRSETGLWYQVATPKRLFELQLQLSRETLAFSSALVAGKLSSYTVGANLLTRPMPWVYVKPGLAVGSWQADLSAAETSDTNPEIISADYVRFELAFGLRYDFMEKFEIAVGMNYRSGSDLVLVFNKFVEENFVYGVEIGGQFAPEIRLGWFYQPEWGFELAASFGKSPISVAGLTEGGKSEAIAEHRWVSIAAGYIL